MAKKWAVAYDWLIGRNGGASCGIGDDVTRPLWRVESVWRTRAEAEAALARAIEEREATYYDGLSGWQGPRYHVVEYDPTDFVAGQTRADLRWHPTKSLRAQCDALLRARQPEAFHDRATAR